MTYNFDPDQWLDIQKTLLEKQLGDGTITRKEYESALEQAEQRYHKMWKYLDGTYEIPDE